MGRRSEEERGGRSAALANKTMAVRVDGIEEPLEVVGWVVALNGNHRGQDFRLHTGKNVIGTAADCDIVVTDPYLSSKHATIRHDTADGSFTIIDLDSTNGTYLNDKRISKDELIDNDTVRLGRTELKFKALF
ncbi:MAG: FHA domain-containing protein [Deltaproteobacteria bacterium]|nr:FHA domain-containing protein [Deltaproteobacteria bacterium]